MAKQIMINEKVRRELDYIRRQWSGRAKRPISYSDVIEKLLENANIEDLVSVTILRSFDELQSKLPRYLFHDLEVVRALVNKISQVDDLQRERVKEEILGVIKNMKVDYKIEI